MKLPGRLDDRPAHQHACPVQESRKLRTLLEQAQERERILEREKASLVLTGAQQRHRIDSLQKCIMHLEQGLEETKKQLEEASSRQHDTAQVHEKILVTDPDGKIHAMFVNLDADMSQIHLHIAHKTGCN